MNSKDKRRFNTKKIQNLIYGVAEAYTNDFFEMFRDERYRGKNFTWERFPEIVASCASTGIFLNCRDWDDYSDNLQKAIKEKCKEVTLELARRKIKNGI